MTNEFRAAFLSKGYIPIIMGGGITGDCQINDIHLHSELKSNYREQENALMIEKLKEGPKKSPQSTRNKMMKMLNNAIKSANIDCADGFKSLFVTNNFGRSEDFLVSDKIYNLVGREI